MILRRVASSFYQETVNLLCLIVAYSYLSVSNGSTLVARRARNMFMPWVPWCVLASTHFNDSAVFVINSDAAAWKGSVQGAVATWSPTKSKLLENIECWSLTRSLPLSVLTPPKCDSDFSAKPLQWLNLTNSPLMVNALKSFVGPHL